MTYLTIDQAAKRASVPVGQIIQLVEAGLLDAVEKGNSMFLSSRETYKLRFIMYLQNEHHLRLMEIEEILKTHKPPYADWKQSAAAVH